MQHVIFQGLWHRLLLATILLLTALAVAGVKESELPVILVGIMSAREHVEQRNVIRRTWASSNVASVVVKFVVGSERADLHTEAVENGAGTACSDCEEDDVLVVPLPESYQHLLDKFFHFLVWAMHEHGGGSTGRGGGGGFQYLVKADDDTYLHLPGLAAALAPAPRLRHYRGHFWVGRPVRDPGHKNHLAARDYPLQELPPYAYGGAYVLSRDLATFVYRNLAFLSPGAMRGGGNAEDVQVGLWALALGVRGTHDPRMVDAGHCHARAFALFNADPPLLRALHRAFAAAGDGDGPLGGGCGAEVQALLEGRFRAQLAERPGHAPLRTHVGARLLLQEGRAAEAAREFEALLLLLGEEGEGGGADAEAEETRAAAAHNLAVARRVAAGELPWGAAAAAVERTLRWYARRVSVPRGGPGAAAAAAGGEGLPPVNASLAEEYVLVAPW